jgi:release factor glutamine methyltransferase
VTADWPPELGELAARLRGAGCVFAEEEAALLVDAAADPAELSAMLERRLQGWPLEPLLGWAEFCGLRLVVTDGVFVPRRRTRLLVEQAVALASEGCVVVDLCCGVGAVGAAVAAVRAVRLHACELEERAAACARQNLAPVHGTVHRGDLYRALPPGLRGGVDLLVANAPYVPSAAVAMMPPEARLFEPLVALDGGTDGLDVQRRIVRGATSWLRPGGWLLIETSRAQAPGTVELFLGHGLTAEVRTDDDLEATVVIGRRSDSDAGPGAPTASQRVG